jgi:hypothetical protein
LKIFIGGLVEASRTGNGRAAERSLSSKAAPLETSRVGYTPRAAFQPPLCWKQIVVPKGTLTHPDCLRMSDTQTIPWKRISVEAAAIVASILLAFSIDAWWGEVQQRRHLQTVLIGLEAMYAENVTLLDENIELLASYRELLKQFIETKPSDTEQIPVELTFDTLESIWRPVTPPNNNSLLVTTLASENMTLLEDPALQYAIGRWRAQVDILNERTVQLVESESEALLALGHHPDVAAAWVQATSGAPRLINGDVLLWAREDQNIMAIAARKAFQSRIHMQALRDNRDASSEVLDLIRMALRQ